MDNKYKNKSEGITTYKVGKVYRKNGLSLSDGGETVCVKFVGNYVKEYNNIKSPWAYMMRILQESDNTIIGMWIKGHDEKLDK